ncbi:MAG: tyrosine-protein phosphatase [Erysipelotrichaceae bacterium]|nr:tyrosine-protein phosphatase [Erysipelotrichaceae bacterium]
MKRINRYIALILCGSVLITMLSSCTKSTPKLSDCGVVHEPEFGGIYIKKTIDEFNALGFNYGDSVTVTFSNGYVLEDIPYYNGYYTRNGERQLIAYPGYDYIKAVINNGADLWDVAGIDESTLASITLYESGKYKVIQEARDLSYKDDRNLFESDEMFANFRNIQVGKISEGLIYRSASPCDNQHNRAPYVDRLINEAGVRYIVDLADNDERIMSHINKDNFDSPYFLSLYYNSQVYPMAMNTNYESMQLRQKIADGMRAMLNNDGPYLVHCTEGKDRTGFICMLIEALCGASYQEIVDDYMITYKNYYGITREKDEFKYVIIVNDVLHPMIRIVIGDENADVSTADLSLAARGFLIDCGMSDQEVSKLIEKLTY